MTLDGLSGSAGVYTDASKNLTSTPPSSGTIGFWDRSGTTLSPVTAGDALSTTGDISTTGTGTITSAGLLTGSAGTDISGGAVNLNANSNNPTNINTGTSTENVTIGGTANSVILPGLNSAGVVHTDATGVLSTGKITNTDITNATIDLTAKVTEVLPVANGGTGQSTYNDGELLIGNSSDNSLTKTTLTGTTNQVVVTNGNGSITLSTPQDIHTGASPTFNGLTLDGLSGSAGVYTDASKILTSTPPSSGTIGFWDRSGTTLSPVTAGDALSTTGDISTTGTGTITSAGLLTGSAGTDISGGAVNLNANSNNPTNINTGTSTENVTIGGTANSVILPGLNSAGVVHTDATGVLSTGKITNTDITNATIDLTAKVTGVLPVANGGTGQTTQQAAINALAGSTTDGQFLRGDGTDVTMSAIQVTDVPILNQNTTGNAATATALETARKINGVSFDGTADITVAADAGTLTGTTLNSNVVNSSLTSVGTLTDLTVTNPISGSVTGNAATATTLETARKINGVSFDGTADITVAADAGTLTGTTLNSNVINSSLTSVGTLTDLTVTNPINGSISGNATNVTGTVAITNGGTGQTTQQAALNALAGGSTAGQFLRGDGTNVSMSAIQAADVPTLNQSTTGNAATATALETARKINGVDFDGTADITVTAAAGTLTGNTLNSTVVNSSLTSVGTLTDLTVTNPISGSVTGNAATATALETARNINGVSFDGTADITVTADAGTLSGNTLNSTVVNSSLTSVGTLTDLTVTNPISGSVTGTSSNVTGTVTIANGGTGQTTQQAAINALAGGSTAGQFLRGDGTNVSMSAIQAADVPTLNQSTTGNAATATALETARKINGVDFDGTADITVTAAAGTLTGNTLNSTVVNSSLTSVGTLTDLTVTNPISGSVTGTSSNVTGTVTIANGGTGQTTQQAAINALAGSTTDGQFLRGDGTDVTMSAIQVTDVPILNQNTTGNAATATALETARNINGVSFDGTADITVTADAGTLTGNTLNSTVVNSSLTSVGTLTDLTVTNPISGSVTGTSSNVTGTVTIANGGTGQTTQQAAINALAGGSTAGQFLRGDGTNVSMSAIQAADVPTLNQSTTGNAATATALETARKINGVDFDGTADITVTAAAGTLTGNTLNSTVVNSSLTSVGTLTDLTVTNPISGSVTGNAATATALETARNINGVSFDGTADITVTADAGTLSGNTLNSTVVNSSLTSVGTLTDLTVTNPISGSVTGNATTATTATNLAGGAQGSIPYQTAPGTTALLPKGTAGQVLAMNGTATAPEWTNAWLVGGNKPGSDALLGTTDNSSINFQAGTGTITIGQPSGQVKVNNLIINGSGINSYEAISRNGSNGALGIWGGTSENTGAYFKLTGSTYGDSPGKRSAEFVIGNDATSKFVLRTYNGA